MRIVFGLILFYFCLICYGQTSWHSFNNISAPQGLPTGIITAIVQDRSGFLWFGTKEGLFSYDGRIIKTYVHQYDDDRSISDNYITAFLLDHNQRLWIATRHGLNVYDDKRDDFIRIKLDSLFPKVSYSVEDILCMQMDKNGCIWMGGFGSGLTKLCFLEDGLQVKNAISFEQGKVNSPFPVKYVWSILLDHQGNGWIGTAKGLIRFDPYAKDISFKNYTKSSSGISDDYVLSLFSDKQGNVWMSSMDAMLDVIPHSSIVGQDKDPVFIKAMSLVREKLDFSQETIYTGSGTKDGYIWLGTQSKGILKMKVEFDKGLAISFDQTANFRHSYTQFSSLLGDAIFSIFEDTKGNVWIGNDKGVSQYIQIKQKMDVLHLADKGLLVGNSLTSITEWHGHSFFLSGSDSIYCIRNGTTEIKPFFYDKNIRGITDMVFTPSGDLYISSILNGVIHVSSQELDRYLHKINKIINKSNRIKIDHRYDITVNGLCAIDDQYVFFAGLNHAGFIHILSDSVQELVTPDDHFPQFKKCMLIGHQIFIASESGLFVVIDRSIIIYKPANGKEINERINCICHHKANIYLGTANGLIIVNTAIDSLKYFTLTDGLVGNNIQSIVSDDNGRVWLATRSGLSCLDPATHHSINYTEKDGLLSNQLNRLALRDSILLITSENGLNSLSTHDRISEENNSAIHLIDFKISGTSILKNKNSINAINYMYNRSIKLPWYVNNFSAEFTVPEFNHPDNVEYQYRLVPFDKEWIQSGNEGKANYTNLPAGNYSLSLKYKIKSGEWHIQDNSVSIVVGTAWFRSWWFYGLCGISFAGLIYGYYRMQIRQFSRLQDTKNTIAADLHDEIGSTITSINILGKILEQSISATDTSSKKIIDQITTQSKNIQQNLSDIVWSIRPENELAENLEIRVREFLDRTLEPLGIDVKFEISGKKSDHRLNEIYRKEILLILKEAINNIAKHSNATQVKISFTYLRDQVIISIEDNGSSKINVSSGTGIKSMQARAEKLKGSLQWDHTNGNRIKLSIPLV